MFATIRGTLVVINFVRHRFAFYIATQTEDAWKYPTFHPIPLSIFEDFHILCYLPCAKVAPFCAKWQRHWKNRYEDGEQWSETVVIEVSKELLICTNYIYLVSQIGRGAGALWGIVNNFIGHFVSSVLFISLYPYAFPSFSFTVISY